MPSGACATRWSTTPTAIPSISSRPCRPAAEPTGGPSRSAPEEPARDPAHAASAGADLEPDAVLIARPAAQDLHAGPPADRADGASGGRPADPQDRAHLGHGTAAVLGEPP